MLIVGVLGSDIQLALERGQGPRLGPGLSCPDCGGALAGWGSYRRLVRTNSKIAAFRIQRAICHVCAKTHALFPAFLVPGRCDLASAVLRALTMAAGGQGHRPIACELEIPGSTVRGWLRRLRRLAQPLSAGFTSLALELGQVPSRAPPEPDPLADLTQAITAAHERASTRLSGSKPAPVGCFSVSASRGLLLTNTNRPFAG